MDYKAIAEKIIKLKNEDLALRDRLIETGQLENGYNSEMEALHIRNADILNGIIDECGYPTVDLYGKEASESAWLIIQHSISNPAFMKKCAVLLESAVLENKADPINLAYLTDRIAVFEGKPQSYGTQFDWTEKGTLDPQEFDDLDKVNQRRHAIGLNSLTKQIEIMREQAKKEGASAPLDFEKRKLDMDNWSRKVGWIQ